LNKAVLCAPIQTRAVSSSAVSRPCVFPLRRFYLRRWQARRESNPQPAVLETAALPIELLALKQADHSMILATTPAPTVRPPSRIANRNPSSIAIGAINFTVIFTLSPGITISTPSGNSTAPVTSVVLK
jgi:hypothetical protein